MLDKVNNCIRARLVSIHFILKLGFNEFHAWLLAISHCVVWSFVDLFKQRDHRLFIHLFMWLCRIKFGLSVISFYHSLSLSLSLYIVTYCSCCTRPLRCILDSPVIHFYISNYIVSMNLYICTHLIFTEYYYFAVEPSYPSLATSSLRANSNDSFHNVDCCWKLNLPFYRQSNVLHNS